MGYAESNTVTGLAARVQKYVFKPHDISALDQTGTLNCLFFKFRILLL